MADSKKGRSQRSAGGSNLGLNDFVRILKGMRQDREARGQRQVARPTSKTKAARSTAAPTSAPAAGREIGYGVTDTGTPGGLSMPGGTDPRNNQPIPASQASNIFKLNIPFSTEGVTNIMGNPISSSDFNFQVVGDGVNWQDPANAGLLSQYTTPEAINRQLNTAWAMSSLNPNRDKNMAAFIDSGHAESLLTGLPPTAMPSGYSGLFNPATTGLNTPWSQQYAAANQNGAASSASASTPTQGTKSTTPLAGKDFKNIKEAYRTSQETGQRFGTKDIRALGKTTGKDMFDVVKTLREQKQKEGQTGGLLTQEAREKLRSIKENRQDRQASTAFDLGRPAAPSFDRKETPAAINVDKGRLASKVAQQSKVQRQENKTSSISQPKPAPKGQAIAPRGTSTKVPGKSSPAPSQNVKRKI